MTTFGNRFTVEEFKANTKSAVLNFNYATRKDENGVNQKLYYNDADGMPTNVQKIAISNEAGKTVAWCSKEVAEEIAAGKNITSRELAVVEVITEDNVAHPTLLHPSNNNRIEGISL